MGNRKVRMGMVGGSMEGFIGPVHRMAARLDNKIDLVCGAFSSDSEKSRITGSELMLDTNRVYLSFEEMMEEEKSLDKEQRMEFVSIVTPNFLHYKPAKLALENGFHVLCEKPLAISVQEALELEKIALEKDLIFGITHNYTGYPMIKEAAEIVRSGKLGKIRKIIAEYPQGWLSSGIENQGQKQAGWRTDPKQAGISCCVADIGTHAENLLEYITGLKITEVCADVSTFVEGRLLDDDANILIRMNNGAKGVITVSQVAAGEENELKIRIYGERGGIEWLQSNPGTLILKSGDEPQKLLSAGNSYLSDKTKAHTRLPGGHPEGYIESLANLYRNFSLAVKNGKLDTFYDFPSISDGVRGMKFIEAVINSGKQNSKWIEV